VAGTACAAWAFGAQAPRAQAQDAPADLTVAVSAAVSEIDRAAEPVGALVSGSLRRGRTRSVRATLDPGQCYAVVARAARGIEDLDVAIAQGRTVLERDEGAAPEATVRHCAGLRPERVRVTVRAVRGAGAFAAGIYKVAAAQPAPVSAAPTPEVSPPARTTSATRPTSFRAGGTGSDFIAQRVRARQAELARTGVAITDLVAGTLRTSESRTVPVRVEGAQCYMVIGAGVPSIRDLDLQVFDALGNEMARDRTHDASPSARFCATVAGSYRVVVRLFNGYGRFGVQIFTAR